jgi:hypothetical protein
MYRDEEKDQAQYQYWNGKPVAHCRTQFRQKEGAEQTENTQDG